MNDSTTATYLSRNGGLTWESIRSGNNIFAAANYGSIFLLLEKGQLTNHVAYSFNQGYSWINCQFNSNLTNPLHIYVIPQSDPQKFSQFLVTGTTSDNSNAFITFLDFNNIFMAFCLLFLLFISSFYFLFFFLSLLSLFRFIPFPLFFLTSPFLLLPPSSLSLFPAFPSLSPTSLLSCSLLPPLPLSYFLCLSPASPFWIFLRFFFFFLFAKLL